MQQEERDAHTSEIYTRIPNVIINPLALKNLGIICECHDILKWD